MIRTSFFTFSLAGRGVSVHVPLRSGSSRRRARPFYPASFPAPDGHWLATVENPDSRFLERAGNFCIIVDPRQRKGIGKKLLTEAAKRWPLNFEQQNYTEAGASLVQNFLQKAS